MTTAKPSFATEVSEIQERMAQIRHEMHQEVQGAVKGAHQLTDWRSLVGNYPWVSLGIAAAVGYLIVPRRAARLPTVVTPATAPQVAALASAAEQPTGARRSGWKSFGAVSGYLVPVVIRAAQNYALHHFERWLAAHPLHPREPAHGVRPAENKHEPAAPGFQGTPLRESR